MTVLMTPCTAYCDPVAGTHTTLDYANINIPWPVGARMRTASARCGIDEDTLVIVVDDVPAVEAPPGCVEFPYPRLLTIRLA
jgi:hypothetical protein